MKRIGISGLCMLILMGLTFSESAAQLGFKGVGGRLGFVSADGDVGTIVFGGHVNLGEIIPGLALVPSLDYWTESTDVLGVSFDQSALSINGDVRYYFPTGGNIDLFAEGGLGIVRVSVDTQLGDDSKTEIGLNLGGGAEIPFSDNLVGTAMLIFNTEGSQIKIMGGVTFLLGE